MTIRIHEASTSVEELEAIETITDTAFWQLMLVDDIAHATYLVELLVQRLRARVYEIRIACPSCPWTEEGPLDGFDDEPPPWKPRYNVQKAPGVGGDPIPKDEPVLVIRAQDVLADEMMVFYIGSYHDQEHKDPAVEAELREHLAELRRWRTANADRIKVADR